MPACHSNGHWQRKRELKSNPQVICHIFFCNMSVLSILLGVAGSNQWNLFGSIWVCSNMLNFVDGMIHDGDLPGLGDGKA